MLTYSVHEVDRKDPLSDIRNLWLERLNRQHNQVLVQYHNFSKKYLGGQKFFKSLSAIKAAKNKIGKKAIGPLLGLQCALLRASSKGAEESAQLLKIFEEYLIDSGSMDSYFYHYELSQRRLEEGNFPMALYHSRKMDDLAGEPLFSILASIHCLICLENLGMPTESIEEDIHHRFRQVPRVVVIDQQWRAFLSRKYFRGYDLEKYFQLQLSSSPGQETFHRAWVLELPYLPERFDFGLCSTLEKCLLRDEAPLGFSKYTINTLLGRNDAAESPSKLAQKCDRLYLWTWKWIVDRGRYPIEAVLTTLQSVLESVTNQELTVEDQFLLSNSLLWLAILDDSQRGRWVALSHQFAPRKNNGYDVFSLEQLILKYLLAKKDRDSMGIQKHIRLLQKKIQGNPNLAKFPLLSLIDRGESPEGLVNAKVLQLKARLISIEQGRDLLIDSIDNPASSENQVLRLDLATGLCSIPGGHRVRSIQLTRALHFLHSQGRRVNYDDFTRVVFGARSYTDCNLRSRSHTLLSKIRIITKSKLGIRLVGEVILIDGQWPKIEFNSSNEPYFAISGKLNSIVNSFLGQSPDRIRKRTGSAIQQELYQILNDEPGLTRQQLQDKLGLPKTSLLRMLKKEIKIGMIRAKKIPGANRKIKYCSAV